MILITLLCDDLTGKSLVKAETIALSRSQLKEAIRRRRNEANIRRIELASVN